MDTRDAAKPIPAAVLEEWAARLLNAGGYTGHESALTARSLVLANLMGHDSHGVIRVPTYIAFLKRGEFASGADLQIASETPAILCADAAFGLGQVQMPRLLDRLIAKAGDIGTATGTLRNCGHTGRVGEWTEYLAERGFAGMILVNDNGTEKGVAPPGGRQGVTSTNPVAFAVPLADGATFSVDFSTSATASGKTRIAWIEGLPLPEGQAQDAQGRPTTDPAALWTEPRGTLLPMGGAQGYKGFALSMMADCLASGLSGGFTPPAPEGAKMVNNVLATVWNPALFRGAEHMGKETRKYMDFVRSSAPVDPARPVRLPGERAAAEKARRSREGIPLGPKTLALLANASEKYGVAVPEQARVLPAEKRTD